MSAPPYMKLYVGDYLGDTHHLGALEHGAYLLLLMAMWRAGGSLPAIEANLAKMARCTPDEWQAIRADVLPFFTRSRNRLTHKRLSAELAKYESTSGKRSEAGKRGGRQKTSENKAPLEAIAFFAESNCTHNQNQNQNQKEKKEVEAAQVLPLVLADPPVRREASPTRGSRLADDWTPSAENVAYAMRLGFSHGEVERMVERFRNFWISKAGRDAVKLDWSRTWQNWASTEAERRPKAANGTTGRVDWV